MEVSKEDVKSGTRWLFGAGLFACFFAFCLFLIDQRLSNSTGEKDLGATLKQLRTAQTSLNSLSTDERLKERSFKETSTDTTEEIVDQSAGEHSVEQDSNSEAHH